MYKPLIHAATQHKQSAPYLYYQTHIPFQTRTAVRTNYQNVNNTLKPTDCRHTCVLVTCIRTYIYRRMIALPKSNYGIQLYEWRAPGTGHLSEGTP
jgi:adenosyl cobinamide kinase/adenosyl cobinamide phosphate guanylyltransferase